MNRKALILILMLLMLCASFSACENADVSVSRRRVRQGLRTASVLTYTPENFDFRGGRTPLLLYLTDTRLSKRSALEKIEENGLKAIADRESCNIVFLSPADGRTWKEKDYRRLQTVAGSTKDSWFPGDETAEGFADGMFLSSHFRLYVFAEGNAADYVKNTLDVPGSDFLIKEYGMNCGGFAAGYVYAPEGFTEESVNAGWEAVKEKTRMFTDKDTSVACTCPDYESCGITETKKEYTASSGRKIEYYEYLPASLSGEAVTPLVVLFHGRGMHPDAYAWQSAWPRVAAEKGFRIISVAGPYDKDNSPDIDKDITAVTHELIADYVSSNPVDPKRVYAAGFSMGAFRVLDLAARYPDTFAAIAPCDPVKRSVDFSAPVPVFFFGGAKDNYRIFPTQNVWCGPLVQNMAEVNGITLTFDAFAGNIWNIAFDAESTVTDEDTGLVIHLRELKDGTENTRLILSETEDMGHSVLPKMSKLIWNFFKSVS